MITQVNKKSTEKMLEEMGIKKYQIFVSLSNKDKDLALRLLAKMDSLNMHYWCMYYANGEERNKVGDNYKAIIADNLRKTCLFVFLFSRASITSKEVKEELDQAAALMKADPVFKFLPICLDNANQDELPQDIKETGLFEKGVIYGQLPANANGSIDYESAYSRIISEIRTQYYNVIMESARVAYQAIKQSSVFSDLLRDCIHRKCNARSVSQDIKTGDEGSCESLLETHILTDEIVEYDQHPYSCMLISSNLLGNRDSSTGKYNPKKNGVKYFYYCDQNYLDEVGEAFRQKVRDYLLKNRISRGEVVLLIRREFAERNRLLYFVDGFNNLTKDDLLNKYNIVEPDERESFLNEINKDINDYYFCYTEHPEDALRVPDTFYTWMSENHEQLYNDSVREDAYLFVEFLNRLADAIDKIKSESTARAELLKQLKKNCRYLNQLVSFERWQMGDEDAKLCPVTVKKLSKHLIGFTEGSSAYNEEFPNLSDWMRFSYDRAGKLTQLDDQIIEDAMSNLIFVPLAPDISVKPCYSFVVFVNKDIKHASWYSTGYEYKNRNMVISYETDSQTDHCKAFADAFVALIKCDPSIEAILRKNKSKMII